MEEFPGGPWNISRPHFRTWPKDFAGLGPSLGKSRACEAILALGRRHDNLLQLPLGRPNVDEEEVEDHSTELMPPPPVPPRSRRSAASERTPPDTLINEPAVRITCSVCDRLFADCVLASASAVLPPRNFVLVP